MTELRPRRRAPLAAFVCLLAALAALIVAGPAFAQDAPADSLRTVRLLLYRTRGFQMAGFIAAERMHVYREFGLDVQFDPERTVINPVPDVVQRRFDFGVWNAELAVEWSDKQPVVVLAALYQHSPMVLLARHGEAPNGPGDLAGRPVRFSAMQGGLEFVELFRRAQVTGSDLDRVAPRIHEGGPIGGLLAGGIDAVVAFWPSIPRRYPEHEQLFTVMRPIDYGIDIYGDCLFTSESLLLTDPQLVEDFRQATIYGWQYALAHPEAAATMVREELGQGVPVDSLLVEARLMAPLSLDAGIEFGRLDFERWRRIESLYRDLGAIRRPLDLDRFLYDPYRIPAAQGGTDRGDGIGRALIGLLVLVLIVLGITAWRLVRVEKARKRDLSGAARATAAESKRSGYLTEEQFRREVLRMGTALWDWRTRPSALKVSDQFLEFAGYDKDMVAAHPREHLELIHPDDRETVQHLIDAYLTGKASECTLEFRLRFGNGEYRWLKSRVVANRDERGRPVRVVGSLLDISERVRAEEERDRLFNLSVDMLAVGDYEGYLQQINPAWVRVLGWSRDDLMADPMSAFIHEDDRETFAAGLQQLERGEQVEDLQCRFRCRDKTYRWLSWNSFPYHEHRRVFSVVRDITRQKEDQFKLRESQERLRSLSNQLSLVEDRQRRQLAEAIHNGLAQQIFGVRALVTLLRYPEKLDDMQQVVTDIFAVLDKTMAEARSLSFELFPAELQEVGLEAALGWMTHEFQARNGIECEVRTESEAEEAELSEDLRAMAYQCVRELFNNVRKHAKADTITVTLNHVERFLTIVVADDGRGFEPSHEESEGSRKLDYEGFGLFSIRERVRSVGGRMLVDSRPGHGCRVFLSFPLDTPAS